MELNQQQIHSSYENMDSIEFHSRENVDDSKLRSQAKLLQENHRTRKTDEPKRDPNSPRYLLTVLIPPVVLLIEHKYER